MAGVAVAAATARRDDKEKEELLERQRVLSQSNEYLREEKEILKQELAITKQRLESQATIKDMEVEIAILRTKNELLSQQREVIYLPESKLPFVDVETPEKRVVENSEEVEDRYE